MSELLWAVDRNPDCWLAKHYFVNWGICHSLWWNEIFEINVNAFCYDDMRKYIHDLLIHCANIIYLWGTHFYQTHFFQVAGHNSISPRSKCPLIIIQSFQEARTIMHSEFNHNKSIYHPNTSQTCRQSFIFQFEFRWAWSVFAHYFVSPIQAQAMTARVSREPWPYKYHQWCCRQRTFAARSITKLPQRLYSALRSI